MPNFITEQDFIREALVRGKVSHQIRWDLIGERFPDWDIAKMRVALQPKVSEYAAPLGPEAPEPTLLEQIRSRAKQAGGKIKPVAQKYWEAEKFLGRETLGFAQRSLQQAPEMLADLMPFRRPEEQYIDMARAQAASTTEREIARAAGEPEPGWRKGRTMEALGQIPFLGAIPRAISDPYETLHQQTLPTIVELAALALPIRAAFRGRGRPTTVRGAAPEVAPELAYAEAPGFARRTRVLPEFEPTLEKARPKEIFGKAEGVGETKPEGLKIAEKLGLEYMGSKQLESGLFFNFKDPKWPETSGIAGRNLREVAKNLFVEREALYRRPHSISRANKVAESQLQRMSDDVAKLLGVFPRKIFVVSNKLATRETGSPTTTGYYTPTKPQIRANELWASKTPAEQAAFLAHEYAHGSHKGHGEGFWAQNAANRERVRSLLSGKDLAEFDKRYRIDFETRQKYAQRATGEPAPVSPKGDIVELHAGIPLGKMTPEFVKKGVAHVFHQARNRVKHPASKQTIDEIQAAWGEQGRLRGSLEEYMRKEDFWKISNKEAEVITKHRLNPDKVKLPQKLQRANQAIEELFANTFIEANRAGVKVKTAAGERPIKEVPNYVPRRIKPQITRKIFDDVVKARRDAKAVAKETGQLEDLAFAEIVDGMYRNNKFNPEMAKTIAHLIKTKQAKTPGEAVAMIDEYAANDLFSPFGNIERPRILDFPSKFYDNNMKSIVASYIAGFSKRIPEIKKFGQGGEVISKRLSQINRTGDLAESRNLAGIVQRFTGKIEQVGKVHPALKSTIEAYTGFEVTSKIGLGWASVPQTTQPTISFIPLTRVLDWTRGGLSILSKAERSWARGTGAPGFEQFKSVTGMKPTTKLGRVAKGAAEVSTKATMFQQLNKGLQYWAALTAKRWLPHLHKKAQSKIKFRRESAKRQLKDWGIDPEKPLTENQLKESSYRFAMDTQLQRNVVKETMWMNNPKWRWAGLFKRFGYRQFNLVKDHMWREVKHGNPVPMLKLVTGGTLGGEFVIWAKNRLREFLTGRPHYRDEDNMWHRVINDLAAVGSLGWITDIGRFEESTPVAMIQDAYRTMKFQMQPVIVSDVTKGSKIVDGFLRDLDKRGFDNAIRRAAPHVFGLFGGVLASKLKERLKTPQQYKDVMTALKREIRQRALRHADKGDWSRAFDIVTKWNERMDSDFWLEYPANKDILKYRKHEREMRESP